MHELSIAHAVVSTVLQALPESKPRVTEVSLRIGRLSGVVPQALHFAYDVATADTPSGGLGAAHRGHAGGDPMCHLRTPGTVRDPRLHMSDLRCSLR